MPISELLSALVARLFPAPTNTKPTCEAWLLEAAAKAENADDLVMFMSHWNGFVREAATKRAGERLQSGTLRTIIERLNDWVPQVRAQARAAVAAFVSADRFEDVLDAWPDIRRLRGRSREDHHELVELLESWLAEHPRRPRLVDLLRGADPVFIRSMFALELRNPSQDNRALIAWGLECGDMVTSKLACSLIRSLDEAARLELANRLIKVRRGYLKLAGLNYLNELQPDQARSAALTFVLSPYAPLRERSLALSRLTDGALTALIDRALADDEAPLNRRLTAALLCGKNRLTGTAPQLLKLLNEDNVPLRAAALLALFRLDPDGSEQRIREALTDREPRVIRSALLVLAESSWLLAPEEWRALVSSLSSPALAVSALRAGRRKGKWDWLGIALELARCEPFLRLGSAGVENWLRNVNRSYRGPSDSQRIWISQLLETSPVDARTAKLLRFHLS